MRRRSSTTGDSGDPATATSAAHPECALNPIAAGTGLGMNIDYTLDAGVMNLGGYQQRYRAELLERVIPFWLRHSLDREHGGYFTCLTREGAVYDTRKYVWLQGRAAWMLAKLYNELEPRPEWLDAARLILDFIRKHARDREGRYYFSLARDGTPAFYQRKPYSAVFAMLGMLEYAKATGDEAIRNESIDLFWTIRRWIKTRRCSAGQCLVVSG